MSAAPDSAGPDAAGGTATTAPLGANPLDAAIAEVGAEVFKQANEDESAAQTPAPAEPAADNATAEQPKGTAARARAPDGKFIKKDSEGAEAAPSEDAAASAEAPKEDGGQTAEGTPAAEPAPEAPEHWSAEDKAWFEKAPPEVRQGVLGRVKSIEADHTRKSQELATLQKQSGPLIEAMKPFEAYHRSVGLPTAKVVQHLLGVEYQLRTGTPDAKRALLLQTAKDYGIELAAPSAPADAALSDDEFADPQIKAIRAENAQLRQRLDALDVRERQRHAEHADRTLSEVQSAIEKFRTETDASGNPTHPQYETLKAEIGAMMLADQTLSLQDAYDRAVWANPTTRKALQEAEVKAKAKIEADARAKREAEERKRSAEARKGGSANMRPGGSGGSGSAVPKDLDEAIALTAQEVLKRNAA